MHSNRAGLTLIEVLAAIGLLAAMLGMVVVAGARHTRQARLAQDRLAAQEIADRLLADWLLEGQEKITDSRGGIPGRPGWEWRLSGRDEPELIPLGLHVGKLSIVKRDRTPGQSDDGLVVMTTVEFVSSSAVTAELAARRTP